MLIAWSSLGGRRAAAQQPDLIFHADTVAGGESDADSLLPAPVLPGSRDVMEPGSTSTGAAATQPATPSDSAGAVGRIESRQPAMADWATAVDPGRGETVSEHPRPDYDPLGIPAGGFRVFPELRAEEQFDDNIFRTATDRESDFITELAPRLRASSDWNNNALNFEADATIGKHALHPDEDYEDYGFHTDGRLDVTRTTSLDAALGYEQLHEDRSSPDQSSSLVPTKYTDAAGIAGFSHEFGRFDLRLESTFDRIDFSDNKRLVGGVVESVNNDDRDRDEVFGTAKLRYTVSPNFRPFVGGGYGIIRFDNHVDDNGFRRDADQYNALAGADFDLGGITTAELYAGYLAQDFADSRFDTIEGPEFGGKVTWNVTGLTTVTAKAQRGIAVTTLDGASGAVETQAGFTIDHELRRNVLLQLNAGWTQNDYSGIDRLDNIYDVGAHASYLVNRDLVVSAGYRHQERLSDDSTAEFRDNLFLLGLTARY